MVYHLEVAMRSITEIWLAVIETWAAVDIGLQQTLRLLKTWY